jgi:hypothetical protein
LKNLLISTCPRRRIGERTIKDDGRRRAPKPSVFLERCTYYSMAGIIFQT